MTTASEILACLSPGELEALSEGLLAPTAKRAWTIF